MNALIEKSKTQMQKAIDHLKSEFLRMRVGRATTGMVENVAIDVYGSSMTLKELAVLAIPDAKTITIQPWDRGLIGDIEKGLLAANLGLTPQNDGKLIRLNLPPMTEERRKDFVKEIKKLGEDAKISVRGTRRQTLEETKKEKDSGKASEDDVRRSQDEVQKNTDRFVAEIDSLVETKSKEVLSI